MVISLINSYLNCLSLADLKLVAKNNGFKKLSNKKKCDILYVIKSKYAALKIQRYYRKYKSYNSIDPITLGSLMYPFWIKKTQKGWFYYNLEEFARSLVISGDFRDPFTRDKITEDDALKLENLLKLHNIKLQRSIKDAMSNKKYYRNIKDREEQIDILMERIRHIFWCIRDKIDNVYSGYEDIGELTLQLKNIYFPDILHYFNILARKCPKSTNISFENSKQIISDITYDCHVICYIKTHIVEWIEKIKINI